jgi:hypothetical protein
MTGPICCDFDVSCFREPTLDDLLAEPAVRMLMTSDRVEEAVLRRLATEVRERTQASHSTRLCNFSGGPSS